MSQVTVHVLYEDPPRVLLEQDCFHLTLIGDQIAKLGHALWQAVHFQNRSHHGCALSKIVVQEGPIVEFKQQGESFPYSEADSPTVVEE